MTTAALVALAASCWLFRVLFIVLVPAERLPPAAHRALGHLAPAVLAALVTVETDAAVRGADLLGGGFVVAALLLVALVVRRTRSLTWAIGVALAAAVLLDLVLPA